MPNPATWQDVQARWRPLSGEEQSLATTLLADAWVIVLHRIPDIESRMVEETLDPDLVTMVLCAMVLRVMKNPEGKRQESIDDYSYLRDNTLSSGALYLADDELDLLAGAGASSNAFTIRPYGTPGYATAEPDWWEEWQNT